ncbi:MAG TPA: hypothetical protein QGF02_03840 [Candidatus Babeliales bacterium]|nr:hypothetical protein [Candidatus Babeliales bacterium]
MKRVIGLIFLLALCGNVLAGREVLNLQIERERTERALSLLMSKHLKDLRESVEEAENRGQNVKNLGGKVEELERLCWRKVNPLCNTGPMSNGSDSSISTE